MPEQTEPLFQMTLRDGEVFSTKKLRESQRVLLTGRFGSTWQQLVVELPDTMFFIETDDPGGLLEAWPAGVTGLGYGRRILRHLPNVAVLLRVEKQTIGELQEQLGILKQLGRLCSFVGVSIHADTPFIEGMDFLLINTCSLSTLETLVKQAKDAEVPACVGEGPFIHETDFRPQGANIKAYKRFGELPLYLQIRQLPKMKGNSK